MEGGVHEYIYLQNINIYILDNGHFPVAWQAALARPQLKNDGLDLVFNNFILESNLQYISKLAESAVAKQMQNHMSCNSLFPVLQSAYRQYHSSETAFLKVKNDTVLVLLHLR